MHISKLEQVIAMVTSLLYVCACVAFFVGAAGGNKTVPATWLLFLLTVSAGYWSYVSSPGQRHWLINICNTFDVIAITFIVGTVIWFRAFEQFATPFDLWVALAWLVAMLVWILSRRPQLANILFNLALVIAYVPLVVALFVAIDHGESYVTWTCIFAASLLGLLIPLQRPQKDWLAILYASRAVISTGLVLGLMLSIDLMH